VPYQVDSIFNDTMNYFGGLIRIPVSIGGKQEWMLIDNGAAHVSVVSESFAASHGIHPVGATGHAKGSTGKHSSYWVGMADSLSVGELKFRNLLFSVVADASVENPYVDFSTLLGANFFRLSGEMRFDNERRQITFPVRYEEKEANLTVNERDKYFADVCVLGDTLRFFLDLGANSTGLDGNYYKLHKHRVRSAYEPVEHIRYGLGGSKTSVEYRVENLAFETCGGLFVKKSARISVNKDEGPDTYGWIGTDFFFYFDTVTLNLEKMYMYVGSPLNLPAAEHEPAGQVEDETDG
jgi:predicted aspartyl protease